MTSADEFDIVVVGAGPAGESCAAHAADSGARVALVERELVGGECAYWGCMPSKALLRPAQVAAEARRTPGVDVAPRLDVPAVLQRRDEIVRGLDDTSHAERMTTRGIELVRGTARLDGERRVHVELADTDRNAGGDGSRTLTARRAVVLAPGTRAALPPIDGLADAGPWTNREGTLATDAPGRLAIVGGGVIAVELAQAWASLGSEVTIVESADRILLREEPEAAALVHDALLGAGVHIHCGARTRRVTRRDDGSVRLEFDDPDAPPLDADELLVAAGRTANTEHLGLDAVGVTPGRGGVVAVTDCMCVAGLDWLYVIGDANGRAQFTHTAAYQAKVAARNALGIETHCVEDHVAAPRGTFTDPVVCAVGHTLASAREANIDAVAIDRDPQRTAAASFHGRGTPGFARLVFDPRSTCIVGATFVGSDLAELLHSATIAVVGRVPLERLLHCVAPFPTRSEVWTRLIEVAERDERLAARLHGNVTS